MIDAGRIVDLVRDPAVSRSDAIALVEQYGRQRAEHAVVVATDMVWAEVLHAVEHSQKITARESTA